MKRKFFSITLAFSICLLCVFSSKISAEAPVYRSCPNETRKIALTFDDGPHPTQTKRILDILDRYEVHATFFMIGVNVENYPDAAKEVLARGHEIGNHTYSHSHLRGMTAESLSEELGRCEAVLDRVLSYHSCLFRPPEGFLSGAVSACAEQGDYSLVLWSVDTKDWETKQVGSILEKVLKQIKPGDIVLMHDYVAKSKTPEALEILLPKLLALGYEPVTVGELLGIR
jgi:peptidoglycan/xylan/chitin deacetylase (PgdA/CDA1 family)